MKKGLIFGVFIVCVIASSVGSANEIFGNCQGWRWHPSPMMRLEKSADGKRVSRDYVPNRPLPTRQQLQQPLLLGDHQQRLSVLAEPRTVAQRKHRMTICQLSIAFSF